MGFLVTLRGEEMDMSLRNGRGRVDPGAVDMRFLERDLPCMIRSFIRSVKTLSCTTTSSGSLEQPLGRRLDLRFVPRARFPISRQLLTHFLLIQLSPLCGSSTGHLVEPYCLDLSGTSDHRSESMFE